MSAPVPRNGDASRHGSLSPSLEIAGAEASRCIHCGFCLPACPTYQVLGVEKHSPRGRIQLVKAWSDGRVEPDAGLVEALDLCLACRACETACPVGVHYGAIIEGARDELAARRRGPANVLLKWVLRRVAAHPGRLGAAARIGGRLVHGALGRRVEAWAARRPGSWLHAALAFARALPSNARRHKGPGIGPAPEPGPTPGTGHPPVAPDGLAGAPASLPAGERPRAALFLGCAQEGLFPEVNASTARLLAAAGFTVETPAGQCCCGALHRHQGDVKHARSLLRRNLEAFGFLGGEPPDVVVLNAGGCLAWIKEAAPVFEPGTPERAAAEQLAARARELSEILVERGWQPGGTGRSRPVRVVYQPSCHLTHVCGVKDAPLALLKALPGVSVTLPPDGGSCCGSAGIYNALHPQTSAAVLDRKMDAIAAGGEEPDAIVTSNPGCHLQMLAGVRRRGLAGRVAVMQLPEFIETYLAGDFNPPGGFPES